MTLTRNQTVLDKLDEVELRKLIGIRSSNPVKSQIGKNNHGTSSSFFSSVEEVA